MNSTWKKVLLFLFVVGMGVDTSYAKSKYDICMDLAKQPYKRCLANADTHKEKTRCRVKYKEDKDWCKKHAE